MFVGSLTTAPALVQRYQPEDGGDARARLTTVSAERSVFHVSAVAANRGSGTAAFIAHVAAPGKSFQTSCRLTALPKRARAPIQDEPLTGKVPS
jgi:hypothetical protein